MFPLLCWRLRCLHSCTAFTYLCDPLHCMSRLAPLELGTAAALTLWAERNAAALLHVHRCLLVGLPAPRNLVKTCPSCSAVTLVISWTNTSPMGDLMSLSVCAPNPIHYCSALPSDSLYLFLQQQRTSSRQKTKVTEVSNQSAQNILSFLGEICSLYQPSSSII